ncbi:Calx-beta domain-containing protein [Planctomycetota bacterium]
MNKKRTTRNMIVIGMFLFHAIATAGWAGELVSWGWDGYGVVSDTPAGSDFEAVSVGGNHIVALRADGSLVAWGYDGGGQVSNTPSSNDFVAVASGGNHNVALRTDGSLIAWGYDGQGLVSDTPIGNDFIANAAGNQHNVALKSGGSLVSWGSDDYKQVSNTSAGNDFTAVAAGFYHSTALKTDGSLVTWGKDTSGLVSNLPVGNDFIAVAAGGYYSVALKSDGRLVSWGSDTVGQVSDTPAGNDFVAIAAGEAHGVALKSDGSLVAWGYDRYGQVSDTPTDNDFICGSSFGLSSSAIRGTISPPPTTYSLTTNVNPSGSGYVTKYPNQSEYSDGESVQLTATAFSSYTFSHWSGDASGTSNSVNIIMNSNKAVTANFTAITKPTVSITAIDASAGEPANDGSFRISRTGATSSSLRVYYSTNGSTALSGTDYAALPSYVDIPSGQTSAYISVVVINDSTVENSETVRLTISSNAAYNIGSPSYATVTIADDDNEEPPGDDPTVTITALDASAAEPANDGYFTINRTGDTSSNLLVYYSTSGSTASSGTDYEAIPNYVYLLSGQSSASIPVVVIDDTAIEDSETVRLTIWNLSAYTVGSPSNATVTITDNDNAPPEDEPVVTITAPDASAGEPANNGSFRVSRTGATSSNLRVYYSTGGSTASSGADYSALPGYVDIQYGQSSANVSVAVIDDITVESLETVRLTISSNAGYDIGSPSYATVTITDDDEIPEEEPIVTIIAIDASAGEPANDGSFRVSRTGATTENLRVYYSTGGSTASSGYDYTALYGYVDIPYGQSSATIYVVVINDGTVENSETVRLTISSNSAYDIGSPSYATVTITDDDEDLPVSEAEQMMADTLVFYYASIDDGSLGGISNKLVKMQTMLETAYNQIVNGYYDDACVQLTEAYLRCDGSKKPLMDYVSGTATADLAGMIQEVIIELGCL